MIEFLTGNFDAYSDAELEELASIYVSRIRLFMQRYSQIHAEGVDRRIQSFLDADVQLLTEDQRGPVASYIKTLDANQLIEQVYRYKDMPTCFKITLTEIKKRLCGDATENTEGESGEPSGGGL